MKAINNTTEKVIQHTKGEWKALYGQFPIGTVTINTVAENKRICSLEFDTVKEKNETEANAARIVKCVNEFTGLEKLAKYNEKVAYDTSVQNANLMVKNAALIDALRRIKSIYDNVEDTAGVIAKEALKNAE